MLSKESLNGLRLTRDAANMYKGNVTDVPITKELKSYVTKSYQKYMERIEIENAEAIFLESKRRGIKEQVKNLKRTLKQNEARKRK